MSESSPGGWTRREWLQATAGAIACAIPSARAATAPATLYNGIRLADPWPPRYRGASAEPILPPYLVDPPRVIPIDLGRQLFVDDFLIEETSLERTFHRADYYANNPVLWPDTRWEKYDEYAERTKTRSNPAAMPFSDGVFYDPRDRLFKMWYMGGYQQNTCYATSADGYTWSKPALDVVAGTNIVLPGHRDSSVVWLDLVERVASRRYKMAFWHDHRIDLWASPDGIHWDRFGRTGVSGDRSTVFYNPFRSVWVYSLRSNVTDGNERYRRYWETPDLFANVDWQPGGPVRWVSADAEDPRRPEYNVPAEIYNLDCVAYESVLLGLFTMFRGERTEREKPNDVCVGFSRDGFHWHRPDRRAFLPVSEHVGDWNWANVQSAGGCCLVVGDRLFFYVSGRRGVPGSNDPGVCSTGVATLRRDGFASMDDARGTGPYRVGGGAAPGTLTTRPVRFTGRYLFVNANAAGGEIRVEALDEGGAPIDGFSAGACTPVLGDRTKALVSWNNGVTLDRIAGEAVRFRFHVNRARLYAFWASATTDGRSRGFVGAGGPGFTTPADV